VLVLLELTGAVVAEPGLAGWPQWGGPNRDFTVEASGLADSWPEGGPKELWKRELGDGYASIVSDGSALYTLYRKSPTDDHEITVALDARSGRTIWEHSVPSAVKQPLPEYGHSPNSTPLIIGEHLYTIGANALMHCYRKRDGKVMWMHDLAKEFGAPFPGDFGYANSPVAYKNMIIVPVGVAREERRGGEGVVDVPTAETGNSGDGRSLVAFDRHSGSVVWQRHRYDVAVSSPVVINLGGQDQLVLFTSLELVGIDPNDGDVIWAYTLQGGRYIITPVWIEPDLLFCSSMDQNVGSRMIRLGRNDGRTVPEELWHSRKVRFRQANPVHIEGLIVGSSGDMSSAIAVGVDALTGRRLWGNRGFDLAAYVYADGKVIFLDWNGHLVLATATRGGLTVHSQFQITERYSMTAPTLVGTTLYVRDRKHIMALDLGAVASETKENP
jgi:outer membrane protein assembly factor BamB